MYFQYTNCHRPDLSGFGDILVDLRVVFTILQCKFEGLNCYNTLNSLKPPKLADTPFKMTDLSSKMTGPPSKLTDSH